MSLNSEEPVSQADAIGRVVFEPTPAWTRQYDLGEAMDDSGAPVLLQEHQYLGRSADFALYRRQVTAARNPIGVDRTSEFSITFNPSYETLAIHHIWIHRNGEILDVTKKLEIDVIRREEERGRRIYNGDYTVIFRLLDVRPGDYVDYGFSWKGRNPVFAGRVFFYCPLAFDWPVARHITRILTEPNLALRYKLYGGAEEPQISKFVLPGEGPWDGLLEHEFKFDRLEAWENESGAPIWSNVRPGVEFTDFANWGELAAFQKQLYPAQEPQGLLGDLVTKVQAQSADIWERAAAALRFVQDEIRYTAISYGEGGYRPRDTLKVLERRYGDCKDKTQLLAMLLRANGVECAPALVHTQRGRAIADDLPSPWAFNHVIVWAKIEGRELWLDATAAGQRGPLHDLLAPPFHNALILRDAESGLSPMPRPKDYPPARITRQRIELGPTRESPGLMIVETEHRLDEAEHMRRRLMNDGATGLQENYLGFYQRFFADAKFVGQIEVEDDETNNVLIVRERIELPKPWNMDPAEERYYLRYRFGDVPRLMEDVRTQGRRWPLAVTYPLHLAEEITIVLPDGGKDWTIPAENLIRANAAFRFERKTNMKDGCYVTQMSLCALTDHVPKEDIVDALSHQSAVQDLIHIELFWGADEPHSQSWWERLFAKPKTQVQGAA